MPTKKSPQAKARRAARHEVISYLEALERLGLSRSGPDTQAALGLSKRQLIRFANGHSEVSGPLAILIELMLETGKVRS